MENIKPKNAFIGAIGTMPQLQWLQPAVLTLVVAIVLLVSTGCQSHH